MKRLLFILFLIVVCSVQVFPEMKDKIIAVNGHGEINIEPNVAYLNFNVEVIEKNAAAAQKKNAVKMKKLIQALLDLGLEEEKIETANFSLHSLTKHSSTGKPKIVGYRCDNRITVTVDNLDKIGNIIDTAIISGADGVSRIRFTVKDESKYEQMALERAVEDARAKARAIEKAARLQIKKIHSIIESGARVNPIEISRFASSIKSTSVETPIKPGKIKISADVKMNFEY